MTKQTQLGGSFNLPGTTFTVHRVSYGAMQLAGPHVFGPPRDHPKAIAVLRELPAVRHIFCSSCTLLRNDFIRRTYDYLANTGADGVTLEGSPCRASYFAPMRDSGALYLHHGQVHPKNRESIQASEC
jgi:hypothetical protein